MHAQHGSLMLQACILVAHVAFHLVMGKPIEGIAVCDNDDVDVDDNDDSRCVSMRGNQRHMNLKQPFQWRAHKLTIICLDSRVKLSCLFLHLYLFLSLSFFLSFLSSHRSSPSGRLANSVVESIPVHSGASSKSKVRNDSLHSGDNVAEESMAGQSASAVGLSEAVRGASALSSIPFSRSSPLRSNGGSSKGGRADYTGASQHRQPAPDQRASFPFAGMGLHTLLPSEEHLRRAQLPQLDRLHPRYA